ncbi:F-box/WD-40 repeat-containing protein [Metarhizium album ARSEF 1941]|uniref:F-box/WD-40 repeat-containing protein n=1 Tax=Metarhizium album (strain ARSEF 1941) TaxID=1081103 RepID=A0A0B2WLL0_METAS|nr:F-box/WD-40 repeat-containing protein [Metarhizium album ARSEF 1941]KHN94367.1 F-box/WD-40 repeat-containing protein [Metarhizium album ARSEF 1941]
MDPFSPAHQPDEGYSEDPLNPTVHHGLPASLATLRSPAELPSWLASNASALPVSVKKDLTLALLDHLPTSAIAEIVQRLNPRLYIDFVQYLPAEICLKVLGYLDPISLVGVSQTCRAWYELALDRKLWERLYHLEGWKAVPNDIELCEGKVNAGLTSSIGHLHRIQNADGQTNKIRAILNEDEDQEMTGTARSQNIVQEPMGIASSSIFGTPGSSFVSNRLVVSPTGGDVDMDIRFASNSSAYKGKGVDRSFGSSDVVRVKRKEPGGTPEPSLPPILPKDHPSASIRSTLWAWDINSSRYRINWKYLYNMRRRLESNWELGKYTTFQLPHPHHPEEGHQECVYTLQFDADYLVSGSRDQTMRVWNVRTRRLVRPPLVGHNGSVLCLQFDADPSEDIIVSGSSDSNVFIWKFSTGELIQQITKAHRESVLNVRFDKRILVTSSKDKTIKIFNRRPLRFGDLGYGSSELAFSAVGKTIKPYGYEPDLAQELPVKEPYTMIGRLEGHGAAVNAIQVRGRTIVSVSGDRHIKVWDWPDQVCTQTIPAHDKGIACVEFDGRRIVSGSSDYEVCIFDAPTGLKVAQLRGHAHLVRTVQAGFGDLPYSQVEDEAEAKTVDAEYFKAVEAGEVARDGERRNRRTRRVNAGSSRPADVQAFGAKVPPGGGGGRKYGRIVSGSYDQSIIIWRRDKEGVWKPAHHLRQEEAAAAAQRNTALAIPPQSILQPTFPSQAQASLPMHPSAVPPTMPIPASSSRPPAPDDVSQTSVDPKVQGNSRLYMNLIDQVVPLGARALEQTLANYPTMLGHHNYLQSVIEREPSPLVRTQLRQAITAALVSFQTGQQSTRQRPASTLNPALTAPPAAAGPAVAGPSNLPGTSAAYQPADISTPRPTQAIAIPSLAATLAAPDVFMATGATPMPIPLPTPTPAPAQPAQAPAQHGAPPPAHHHPHITGAENAPARVFKLQFDARKIVCCSQAPVIVGWDFCNGDSELEETARFFATVD